VSGVAPTGGPRASHLVHAREMDSNEVSLERRALALGSSPHRRVVALPADGLGIVRALAEQLLPAVDPLVEPREASRGEPAASLDTVDSREAACGVLEHEHAYGGSVPEGTRTVRRLVLSDAVIEAEAYDSGAETYLSIWATTPERADALEALVRAELHR
jgi:hypothetical protein